MVSRGLFRVSALSGVVAGLLTGVSAIGQVNDDAKRVLEESREAINNIKSITFQAKRSGTGALTGNVDAEGNVKFMRTKSDLRRSPMAFEGNGNRPPKTKSNFHVVSDGNTISWIDQDAAKVFERPYKIKDPSYKDYNFANQALLLQEFIKTDPFAEEVKSDVLSIEGLGEVRGEPCDIVKAAWKNEKGEMTRSATWHIGVADRLPRRLELRNGDEKSNLSMIRELWDLNSDAGLTMTDFALATPDGFSRDVQTKPQAPVVDPNESAQNIQAAPLPPAPTIGPDIGTPMPAFALADLTGSQVSSDSLTGSVVVLSFWGTRFPKSVDAGADIQKVADQFKDNPSVKVLGVACREPSAESAGKIVAERGFTFTVLNGGEKLAKDLKVNGYPSVAIIGKDGKVAAFMQGAHGTTAIAEAINAALK